MRRQALVDGSDQPGGRTPATGPLRLVQDLVNTVDRENHVEALDGPAGLRAWLTHRDLAPDAQVTPADVRRAIELREALRVLLHENNHAAGSLDPEAAAAARAVLAATATRARLRATFEPDAAALVPATPGVAGALGVVVAAAHHAMTTGEWRRLKACPRDVCGWAFHDRSPNNGATWCSMQVCGNRTKATAYYRRQTSGSKADGRTP